MPLVYKPPFVQTPNTKITQFANADGTSLKDVFVPGANGARLDMLGAVNTDSIAHTFHVELNDGTNNLIITTLAIPAQAGNDGTIPAVDLLNSTLAPYLGDDGKLTLPSTWKVRGFLTPAVAAGMAVNIIALGGDF